MAQISLSFRGDFCPVSLSLFHGTCGTLLEIVASMTILLSSEGRVSLRPVLTVDTRPTAALRAAANVMAACKLERPFEHASRLASCRPIRTIEQAIKSTVEDVRFRAQSRVIFDAGAPPRFRRLQRFDRVSQLHYAFKTVAYTMINLRI
jgi:hypothetical protein